MADVNFTSHLGQVLNATSQQLMKAAEKIGQAAESHAKLYITAGVYQTPQGWYVRTGNLRNSITHATEENKETITVVVGTSVEYAPYVELGTGKYAEGSNGRGVPWRYQDTKGNWHTTSGMPPRPYLRPAIENHIPEYKDIIAEVMSETHI